MTMFHNTTRKKHRPKKGGANDAPAAEENPPYKTRHCIQRGPAECIKNAQKSVEHAGERALETAKGVAREVKNCGTGLPNVMLGVADSFKTTAKSLVDSINEVNKALSVSGGEAPTLFGPVYKAYLLYVSNLQQKIDRAILGDMAGKKIDAKQLLQQIRETSDKYKELASLPEFQKTLREITDNYSKGLVKSLDVAQPAIDRITLKGQQMVEQVGERAGVTAGNAASNFLKAAIGEIPLVGGIIGGIISLGDLSNKVIKTCEPITKFSSEVLLPAGNLTADKLDELKCKWLEIQKKTNDLMKKMDTGKAKSPPPVETKGGNSVLFKGRKRRGRKTRKRDMTK